MFIVFLKTVNIKVIFLCTSACDAYFFEIARMEFLDLRSVGYVYRSNTTYSIMSAREDLVCGLADSR